MTDDDEPTDPRHYLTQPPTRRALAITAATTREAGDATPMWMTAALADRGERVEQRLMELAAAADPGRIERIERVQRAADLDRKRTRGYLWKTAAIAGALIAPSVAWFLHARETSAAESQQLRDVILRIDSLERDVREIRAMLHRLGMDDHVPSSGGRRLEPGLPSRPGPDDLSLVERADGMRIYPNVSEWSSGQGVAACSEVAEATRVDQARALDIRVAGPEAGRSRAGVFGTAGHDDYGDNDEAHVVVVPRSVCSLLTSWLPAHLGPERSDHDFVSHP